MRRSSWSKARVPGWPTLARPISPRSEEHTSELQSQSNLVCRLLLEKKKIFDMVFIAESAQNLLPPSLFLLGDASDIVHLNPPQHRHQQVSERLRRLYHSERPVHSMP